MAYLIRIYLFLIINVILIYANYDPVDLNENCRNFTFSPDTPTLVIKSKLNKNCLLYLNKDNAQISGLYVQVTSLTNSKNQYLLNNLSNCTDSTQAQLGPIKWCKKSNTETQEGIQLDKFGAAFDDNLQLNLVVQDKDAINIDLLMTAYKNKKFDDAKECPEEVTYDSKCPGICENDQFACLSRCIPLKLKCDGIDNCGDGSDEADCSSQSALGTAFLIIIFIIILAALILVGIKYYRRHGYA